MIHRIVITPSHDSNKAPRHNSRGALYDVSYIGIIIVTASTEPCLDGARALKALGYSGNLKMWDDITPYVRLTADINTAAKKTIREGDEPPRLVKYASFAPRPALDGDCTSGSIGGSPNKRKPPLRILRSVQDSGRGAR